MNKKYHSNMEIADTLYSMAFLYNLKQTPFKPTMYRRAAKVISEAHKPVMELYEKKGVEGLKELAGVGDKLATHIEEIITTGHFKKYEQMKGEMPADIQGMARVDGVGVKTAMRLWKELGICSVAEMKQAAMRQQIRDLPGLGVGIEERIIHGVAFEKLRAKKIDSSEAYIKVNHLLRKIRNLSETQQAVIAGSYRRDRQKVGDIDIVVQTDESIQTLTEILLFNSVKYGYRIGENHARLVLEAGLAVDVYTTTGSSWGAALVYYTGPIDYNIRLRLYAKKQGYKLNRYGLYKGKRRVAGETEQEIYEKLDIPYVGPRAREHDHEE